MEASLHIRINNQIGKQSEGGFDGPDL